MRPDITTKSSRLAVVGLPLLAIAGLVGAICAAAPAAQAQSTYPAEVENQCKADYYRYCSPYALGSDELRRCMEANGRALSTTCQQALKDAGYVKKDRYTR